MSQYTRYDYIFKNLNYGDEAIFNDIKNSLISFNDENIKNIGESLSFLMAKLEEYYHKKVMVFIDEYDTPFIEAHVGSFYDEIRSGLAGILHNALKNINQLAVCDDDRNSKSRKGKHFQ